MKSNKHKYSAFTIVELLIVVVIIAVLAAISLVMYSGISQKAIASVLQSDLSNAATAIKAFQVEKANFPTTISTNCTTSPDTLTNKCINISNGNNIVGYSANNTASPKSFLLIANNGTNVYRVTDKTAPTLLNNVTQPGITPGAMMELHGARANAGVSQGINSPLTTAWFDTSGSGNNGTLTSFSGSPWSGMGTAIDPYKLTSDGSSNYVTGGVDSDFDFGGPFTIELWISVDPTMATNYHGIITKYGGWAGWDFGIYENKWAMALRGVDAAHSIQHESIGTAYADGIMRHVVVSNTTTSIRPYVDGTALSPQTSDIWTPNTAPGSPVTIFSRGGSAYCKASIAVVRVYPFALSASQVAANYNAGPDW